MTDKIVVVTPPDDTLLDGVRIILVHLNDEQNSIVSNALLNSKIPNVIVTYSWKMGDPVSWLLDKTAKSDLIIFNPGDAVNGSIELILGWVAAQPQSHYFGTLRDLHLANDRVIYSNTDVEILLEKIVKK